MVFKDTQKIQEVEQVINLSEKNAETVFLLLENPPEPNENLKQAAEKHRLFFYENNEDILISRED